MSRKAIPARDQNILWARAAGRCSICKLDLTPFREKTSDFLIGEMAHIIADGWSIGVLTRELLAQLPENDGGAISLTKLPIQYGDYARWQRQWLQGLSTFAKPLPMY